MTRDDIKKAIITGIVGGITTAITILFLMWLYIEVDNLVNHNKYTIHPNNKEWKSAPCKRDGIKEMYDSIQAIRDSEG